jgi:hypothetical protein
VLPVELVEAAPLCPVDRLRRRQRNQLCIWVIAVGLLNYLVYTLGYAALGGDAHNGYRVLVSQDDGSAAAAYFVRGHFIHSLAGQAREVSRSAWIYSYLHSISVPLTSGALIISMLVLARPHILATMRGGWISGQTFVIAFGTIVLLVSLSVTVLFTADFIDALSRG